ncbi:GGDEF domain-containing protein [Ectothiorhodospiraceae bacterium WFHF3C12]|nr:GGDEF domain-containing protein [Ectothiorhodospiraceae bacterium WFHF3C12]
MSAAGSFVAGLRSVWEQGASDAGRDRRRETILANQLGLFGAATTALYEIFYVVYDFGLLWPVFLANLVFIGVYLAIPLINRAGHRLLASHVGFLNVLVQLFVVTYFLSTGAGVQLFYFTLAGLLALMYSRIRFPATLAMALVAAGLYGFCHFRFTPDRAVLPLPGTVLDLLYAGSILGAVLLGAIFSFLFRQEISRAEADLERTNETLEALSERDALTGLANRRRLDSFLYSECQRAAREHRPLSLLMVDVDHFKRFNDVHGHQAGDACLRQVANLVGAAARRPADLPARYGGEEFVLVLPETPLSGAVKQAEDLRKAVAAAAIGPQTPQGREEVTVSIGVATADRADAYQPEALLRVADKGLYVAKRSGRNRSAVADENAALEGGARVFGG